MGNFTLREIEAAIGKPPAGPNSKIKCNTS